MYKFFNSNNKEELAANKKNKLIRKFSVGDVVSIESSAVCTPSMGGYPDYVHRNIVICEDGYQLEGSQTDMSGRCEYKSKVYIEKGFFAKSSFSEIAEKLNDVRYYNRTTPWDFLRNNELQQLIVYEHMSMNCDISSKNALIFNMHKKKWKEYEYKFLYTGHMRYDPAYKPVYWFYLCEMQRKYYMLIFYDSKKGTLWEGLEITESDAEMLASAALPLWIETAYAAHKNNNKIIGIHLKKLNDIKYLLPQYLRDNYITDADYYGI